MSKTEVLANELGGSWSGGTSTCRKEEEEEKEEEAEATKTFFALLLQKAQGAERNQRKKLHRD